jgi:hypothetical protein
MAAFFSIIELNALGLLSLLSSSFALTFTKACGFTLTFVYFLDIA